MITRRGFLALGLVACSRRETPKSVPPPIVSSAPPPPIEPPSVRVVEWTMDSWMGNAATTKVLVPGWAKPEERFPLVIALHGRGEALKGPLRGASGWPDDYGMVKAFDRVRHPPITNADLEDMVDEERVRAMNAQLARGFRGVVVACPYLPDLDLSKSTDTERYGRAIFEDLLPRLRKEMPVTDSTGIDGVSLGGVTALRVGLAHPEELSAVGAIQPAIGEWNASELTELARAARAKNPRLALRLLTSTEDGFRRPTEVLSSSWKRAKIDHEMAVVPGPHDYPFNRGPGVYELLTWHDRVLHPS